MKKSIFILALFAMTMIAAPAYAVECKEGAGGISLSPASEDFSFEAGDVHESTIKIKNMNASDTSNLKVYAAPYSVDENSTKDFTTNKPRTQISRWIEFEGPDGEYAQEAIFEVGPCDERTVNYRVVVPDSIPDGGQYAVIFVENAGSGSDAGIKTVSRAGMLVYGRASGGETIEQAEILDIRVGTSDEAKDKDGQPLGKTVVSVGGEVKNTGNVDIAVTGDFKVTNVFGQELYHNTAYTSVLPDATMKITDDWADTSMIGLFMVTYSLSAPGVETREVTQLVFICPLPVLIVMVLFLIVVIVGIVSIRKKRRERKARYGF